MMSEKQRVALGSVGASAALTIAKTAVGFASGSLAVLSEAAHSLIDFAATGVTYFAVRAADKPADAEHHYGHGKIESIAALGETALLFALSGVVLWEAALRLLGDHGEAVEATVAAFGVIAASIAVDFLRARVLSRTAAAHSSQALAAGALHFASDLWSSCAVLIGLLGVRVGFPAADTLAAIVVALFICRAGWRLARRTIDTLTDTAPAGVAERMASIAAKVTDVVAVEHVRARDVGSRIFAEIEIATSRTLPLDRAERLRKDIAKAVRSAIPNAEIGVIITPRALDNETVMDRVMVIARNRSLPVHHVTVHAIGERTSISLDLEVDGSLSLGAAHEIADGLEAAIRDELGQAIEVETHIEPLQIERSAGTDAAADHIAAVEGALVELAAPAGMAVHDVRVRTTAAGEIVNFHCNVDPQRTVSLVHEQVDAIERGLRAHFPAIKRIIGHAEPRRDH
jgi:cation diffusion facilitator family transporter